MRILAKVQVPAQAGSDGLRTGALPQTIREFAASAKPEAMYFTVADGRRTMFAVVDMASPSDMPRLFEPFLSRLSAEVVLTPCMNADELAAGLQGLNLS